MTSRVSFDYYTDLLQGVLLTTAPIKQQQTQTKANADEETRMLDLIEARSRFILYMQQQQQQLLRVIHWSCSHSCSICYDLQTHRCTANCDFYSYKGYIYICTRTGNVHYCTPVLCDRLNRDNEYSCELTNVIHGLAVDYGKTRQSEMQYHTKGRNRSTMASSLDSDKTYMGPAILSTDVGSCATVSDKRQRTSNYNKNNAKKKKSSSVILSNPKDLLQMITTVITTILTQAMPNLLIYKDTLIQTCQVTWNKIILTSEQYQKHPTSYTIQYHCVIIIYSIFRNSVVLSGTDRYIIAPKILALINEGDFSSTRKLTELQLEFKNKHMFSSTALTNCEGVFLDCALALYNKLKEAEHKMVDYLRTRALHPSIAQKTIIKVESECSIHEFTLLNPLSKEIITKKEYSDIIYSYGLDKYYRTNAQAIHIYVHLTDYIVDRTCPPLYTLTVAA